MVYTDGSCRMNVGGWAWWNDGTKESDSGFSHGTTNQRMELQAALEAVDSHLDDKHLVILSDSQYVVNCFKQKWYVNWEKNNWVGYQGKPIANADIWQKLLALVRENGNVEFKWVKAHNGNPGNEMADGLAYRACSNAYKELHDGTNDHDSMPELLRNTQSGSGRSHKSEKKAQRHQLARHRKLNRPRLP
jgi:ribonuclease HI